MDKKQEKLKQLLAMLNDGLSRDEFTTAFKAVIDYVKQIDTRNVGELQTMLKTLETAISRIKSSTTEDVSNAVKDAQNSFDELMTKLRFEHESMVSEAQAKIDGVKDGIDGKDADEEEIVKNVLAQIPEAIPETAVSIREKLESLEDEDRLDVSAIKGIEDINDEIKKLHGKAQTLTQGLIAHSGSAGVSLTVGSTYLGSTRDLIFSGSGVSSSLVNGIPTVVVTGSGGGGHTIQDEGVSLTQRTKLNFVGAGVTATDDLANDATIVTIPGGSGSGITRSVNSIAANTTAGATASTDYEYLCSGAITLTLPTAVGNTNKYTVTRVGASTVTIATTAAQTINGSATAPMTVQYQSLDLISDGANWIIN